MTFQRSIKKSVAGGDDANNSSRTMVSESSEPEDFPFQHLLRLRLSSFKQPLTRDCGINDQDIYLYDGAPISFDISDDRHTFMVSSLIHKISIKDNMELLRAAYHELEQDLVDMRLEWNDEDEITLYQNLPSFLVDADCFDEFQTIFCRFLKERSKVRAMFRPADCPEQALGGNSGSQKFRSLRSIFSGR